MKTLVKKIKKEPETGDIPRKRTSGHRREVGVLVGY